MKKTSLVLAAAVLAVAGVAQAQDMEFLVDEARNATYTDNLALTPSYSLEDSTLVLGAGPEPTVIVYSWDLPLGYSSVPLDNGFEGDLKNEDGAPYSAQ